MHIMTKNAKQQIFYNAIPTCRRRRIDALQTLKRRRVSTGLINPFKYLELIMIRISKFFRKQIEVLGTNYTENSFRGEFSHSS